MAKYKLKWKWKNGRLHHPTEGFSIGIDEAYQMQNVNEGIGKACKGVLEPYSEDKDTFIMRTITELKHE